ncbi:uncharacterized protein LOC116342558 [Contarinia nasturtii]|uniref:uncharacterized protein LOC116342558 n=1 Tax=Contarinia nasturtii TaxID=265458 RepID=UPI0012D3B5AF|nr:uncharacterized protein LOC116342558 [Contarinia nasturtii]
MIRFVLICWLIAFCWIQSVESTNDFLKSLLTTTPPSSHISDFRKQKRTDSRADKPDMFPGFDLQLDSTTPSARKRRRQAYSKLIRLFLQNTKDRLDTIRDVIKDEGESNFRMAQPQSDDLTESMELNADIRFSDDENRQFIDFAFADATDDNQEKMENNGIEHASQTYLNSLFAAIGYSRITTTPKPIESNETTQSNTIARYFINPLLSAWDFTRQRFNLDGASNSDADFDENDEINGHTSSIFRVNFFEPQIRTNFTSVTNKESNENNVNNFNFSLPLTQHTSNNVTNVMQTTIKTTTTATMTTMMVEENANKVNANRSSAPDVDYNNDHHGSDKKPRNTLKNRNSVEDAAEAFRNAFLKYSNYMQDSTEDANIDTVTVENVQFEQNNSNEMKSDKLLDGARFAGILLDANSSHIQMVPNKKLKTNGSMSENVINNFENDDNTELTAKSFGEKSAVLLLEIFGTVIGMTWRAVSEIPNYFNAQKKA